MNSARVVRCMIVIFCLPMHMLICIDTTRANVVLDTMQAAVYYVHKRRLYVPVPSLVGMSMRYNYFFIQKILSIQKMRVHDAVTPT